MTRTSRLLALALFALTLSGCAGSRNAQPTAVAGVPAPASKVQSKWDFALAAWSAQASHENAVFSPASLSQALALLTCASSGATRTELCKALRTPFASVQSLASSARERIEQISQVNELRLAQRLYVPPDYPLKPDFVRLALAGLGTQVVAGQDPATMDQWVSNVTRGAIQQSGFQPSNERRLLLLNCLFLRALWETPFDPSLTSARPFHSRRGSQNVRTMSRTGGFSYARGPGYQVAELPYAGGALVFDCILPDQQQGLSQLEGSLTAQGLQSLLHTVAYQDLVLTLPIFRIGTNTDWSSALQRMGVRRLFQSGSRELPLLSDDPASVGDLEQQVVLDVDEQGVRAAAVTDGGITVSPAPETPVQFRADHPFLFLIRDQATDQLLFMGRVTDPQSLE